MLVEFKERIIKKRLALDKIKQRCREIALKDTTVICDRCKQDLAKLKTFEFQNPEQHHAKCVFPNFKRVEIAEVLSDTIQPGED
jgi:hypothetical protein